MIDTRDIEQAIAKAADKTTRHMTAAVRRDAFNSGWPSHVVRRLKVVHNDGQFSVTYPESLEAHVSALEYGTSSTSPSPVIRRFNNRLDGHKDRFHKNLRREMAGQR